VPEFASMLTKQPAQLLRLLTGLAAVQWPAREQGSRLRTPLLLALLLTIPVLLLTVSNTLKSAGNNLREAQRIRVFTETHLDQQALDTLASTLRAQPQINELTTAPNIAGLNGMLFELIPARNVNAGILVDDLGAIAGIDFVDFDAALLTRQQSAHRSALLFAAVAIAVALLLAGMLVALMANRDIRNHRQYLSVMTQAGAPPESLRTPFIYRSICVALAAAFASTVLVWCLLTVFGNLSGLWGYSELISISPISLQTLILLVYASLVALATSYFKKYICFYNQ